MPNWCNNTITISGPTEKMQKIIDTVNDESMDGLCSALYPQPENVFKGDLGQKEREQCAKEGIPNWYDWNTSNWGTKWDATPDQLEIEDAGDGRSIITGAFDSAWGPPLGAYEEFIHQNEDCSIEAMYYEGGCAFAGKWEDGNDDYYDLPESAKEIEAQLPEELDEAFGISEWARENEEPEELSEWINESLEKKKELANAEG